MSDFLPIVIAEVANLPLGVPSYYPGDNGIRISPFEKLGLILQYPTGMSWITEASNDGENWHSVSVTLLQWGVFTDTEGWINLPGGVIPVSILCPVPFFRLGLRPFFAENDAIVTLTKCKGSR